MPFSALASSSLLPFLDQLWDAVCVVDSHSAIRVWNRAAAELTGHSAEKLLGRQCGPYTVDFIGNETLSCPLCDTLRDGKTRETRATLRHKLGYRLPVLLRTLPLRKTKSGAPAGTVSIFSGVKTVAREALSEHDHLEQMAYKDALTGLANRRYGDFTLTHWLNASARGGWSFGVLLMDVDHFKTVNDTYGHSAGDAVLRAVAAAVKQNLRPSDFACRWGGDELMALIRSASLEGVREMAERLRSVIAHIRVQELPFLRLSMSIGGTVSLPGEKEHELLARADKNLYAGKEQGRNRSTVA